VDHAAAELRAHAAARVDPTPGERGPHRDVGATLARIAALADAGARPRRIGASALGEPIWSLEIGPTPAPTVFVLAGLHAMEHIGVAAALEVAARALAGGSRWAARRLVVVPLANPDGFARACANARAGRRAFVRANANGVDLNRNFPTGWDGRYALHRALPWVYAAGPAPLSEPETRAIDGELARVRPGHAVSLHAFGRQVFLPFAGSRALPRDAARLRELGEAIARVPSRPYRVSHLGRRSRFFRAPGAEIDHMYGHHGALAFLLELGGGPRLADPASWTEPYRWYNPAEPAFAAEVGEVAVALEVLADA
jgi:hypothetical protein